LRTQLLTRTLSVSLLSPPLPLIIGHSACGAIKAALGDYAAEPAPIRHELNSIHVAKGDDCKRLEVATVGRHRHVRVPEQVGNPFPHGHPLGHGFSLALDLPASSECLGVVDDHLHPKH
jgi:hypothetical protein